MDSDEAIGHGQGSALARALKERGSALGPEQGRTLARCLLALAGAGLLVPQTENAPLYNMGHSVCMEDEDE